MGMTNPFGRSNHRGAFVWPARPEPGLTSIPKRMRRPDDGWERPTDYYPGETVLEDLGPGVSTEDALVIVARFAALRVAILAARPEMPAEALEAERAAAIGHASVLPQRAVERRQLSEVARAVRRGRGPRGLVKLLASAGRSATERGHTRGAFALYYSAWDLAVHAGALPDAVRIARSLAEVAGREGAPRSSRLWARRARALEQRIDRAGA